MGSGTKLGLALSGGGFRAAFFHLGVLAALARQGLLPKVEVISTVSGGAILGAYYALRLKRAMEQDGDDLTDTDFQALVGEIETEFLEAAQRNLRFATFSNLWRNLEMRKTTYSRSDRLGQLFDRYLFALARDGKVGGPNTKVPLAELPSDGYTRRGVTAPRLVINATTLNTGHAWRFEQSTMGEWTPASDYEWDVDRSMALALPTSLSDVIEEKASFSVGKAVAASAAVPGFFHPLAVTHLYEVQLQLVDGGVFDNQGVDALVDAECTHFVVSDAGGQMGPSPRAPSWSVGVALRSAGIQYGRIRQAELERLFWAADRKRARIAFVHARRGVRPDPLPWRGRNKKPVEIPEDQQPPSEARPVHRDVQRLLANVRTDLDSFNNVEARALMLSGYRHLEHELDEAAEVAALAAGGAAGGAKFRFEEMGPWLDTAPSGRFLRILKASKSRFFKPLRLRPVRAILWGALAYAPFVLVAGGIVLVIWDRVPRALRDLPIVGPFLRDLADLFQGRPLWLSILSFGAGLVLAYLPIRFLAASQRLPRSISSRFPKLFRTLNKTTALVRMLVAALTWLFAWFSIKLLDPVYLGAGEVEELGPPPAP